MNRQPVEGIQPSVIRWARESMGLSVDDVAQRLKRKVGEIEAWEAGELAPTYAQLEKLAYEVYKRPLAVFFLPRPPVETEPQTEFRTLPQEELEQLLPDTRLHIRRAHAYQLALVEIFGENPVKQRIWHDLRISPEDGVNLLADRVRDYLGVTMEQQSEWRRSEVALKAWRNALEDKGVFVFKAPFKQREISGFCLADHQFPVIYLNNSTSKTRQVFSLLHELCHLLLEQNGLSKFDTGYIDQLPRAFQITERLCNALAADILIPPDDFSQYSAHLPTELDGVEDNEIEMLANRYGVSREAILRRFLDQRRVSHIFYQYKAEIWAAQQKKRKGGDWYANVNTYLSERFAREVVRQHYRNQLSLEQASDLLGIKANNFEGLEQRILQGVMA